MIYILVVRCKDFLISGRSHIGAMKKNILLLLVCKRESLERTLTWVGKHFENRALEEIFLIINDFYCYTSNSVEKWAENSGSFYWTDYWLTNCAGRHAHTIPYHQVYKKKISFTFLSAKRNMTIIDTKTKHSKKVHLCQKPRIIEF